jgi:hypothetical protein
MLEMTGVIYNNQSMKLGLPAHRYKKYSSYQPVNPILKALDRFLDATLMRVGFLSQVYSHHWHWKKISYDKKYEKFSFFQKGVTRSIPTNLPFQGAIAHLGGRLLGYLIEPDFSHPEFPKKSSKIYYGFRQPWQEKNIKVLEIPIEGKSLSLSGKENCFIYLIGEDQNPVPLKVTVDETTKKPKLFHRKSLPKDVWVI